MLNIKLGIIKLSDIILRFWGISLILLKSIVIYLFLIIVFAHTTPSIDQSSVVSKTNTIIATSNLIPKKITNKEEIISVPLVFYADNIIKKRGKKKQTDYYINCNIPHDITDTFEKRFYFAPFLFIQYYLLENQCVYIDIDGKIEIATLDLSSINYIICYHIKISYATNYKMLKIIHDISNIDAVKTLDKFFSSHKIQKALQSVMLQRLFDNVTKEYNFKIINNNLNNLFCNLNNNMIKATEYTIGQVNNREISICVLCDINTNNICSSYRKIWIDKFFNPLSTLFQKINVKHNDYEFGNNLTSTILQLFNIKNETKLTMQEFIQQITQIEARIAICKNYGYEKT